MFFNKLGTLFRFNSRQQKIDRNKILSEFNRSISLIVDREHLISNITEKIKQSTNFNSVYFYLLNEDFQRFELISNLEDKNTEHQYLYLRNSNLVFWLKTNDTSLVLSKNPSVKDFFNKNEQQLLNKLQIDIIYPLRIMNRLKGIVLINESESKHSTKRTDLELLNIILEQAIMALENATLYHQQQEQLKRMYRADKLAVTGQLAAGTAHEIRNPLTSIRSTIQYLQKDIKDPDKNEMANNILYEVDRINEIIQNLLSFSRPKEPIREKINIQELIQQVKLLVSNMVKKKNIDLQFHYDVKKPWMYADPSQLKQVFLNLLMNSIEALDNKGTIIISIIYDGQKDKRNFKNAFRVIIEDNGPGISEPEQERIFDPFYTTKKNGTGLGLSIAYGIILKHGGNIKINSKKNKGTKVIVKLPAE